jgi:dolichol-phosphate mannosyltransferase
VPLIAFGTAGYEPPLSKTIVLLPTYNERANVEFLIPRIFELQPDLHVLVIDDNSPDDTAGAVREMMLKYPSLGLLLRPGKEGLGAAYKAGMAKVLRDPDVKAVITMDADGSHGPEYLGELRKRGRTYQLVVGSRYVPGGEIEGWEPWRYWLSSWGNFYTRTITGIPLRDITAGFMHIDAALLRNRAVEELRASGYAFLMELKWHIVHTLHATSTEVPITFASRREGESKISQHIITEGLLTPWRIRLAQLKAFVHRQRA